MRTFALLISVALISTCFAAYPTAGLQLHFDAGSLTGYNDGDVVALWPDLAGGDNNGTSAGTPTYVANGFNGKPLIRIDGTSDRYNNGLPKSYDFYAFPAILNVKTIAFVFKPSSSTYYSWAPMMAGPTSENYGWHGDTHWGNAYWDYAYSYNSLQNSNLAIDGVGGYNGGWTGVDYDNFHLITIQLAAGTQFDLAFLAHTARYNDYNVYGMDIAELLIYNQSLSTADLQTLQNELAHKYGIWSVRPLAPAANAANVPINQDLSWQAYNAAWGVDVYLDPNQTNVANGKASVKIVSNQVLSTVDPGELDFDTTYYWRVDLYEPNTVGYKIHQGKVWSFTTIPPDPVVTLQPVSQTVTAGSPVTLTVAGENIVNYQWYLNGVLQSGKISPTLQIPSLGIANEGLYTCVVSNSVGSATSAPAVVVSKRLMGWWKLDGNLNDSVALAVPGALAHNGSIDAPDFVGSGKDGGAYEFMGDNRIIAIADSSDYFNFYPNGLTVSAWVNTAQEGWGGMVSKIDSADTTGFFLTHNGQWLVGGVRSLGDLYSMGNGAGVWQLLTVTLDTADGTIKVYVNGQLQAESDYTTGRPPISPESLFFGAQKADGTFSYAGLLDDVRIYSYPLDAVAVARLYTDLTPGSEVCAEYSVFDTTGPADEPDCKVDIYDFAAMAAQWLDCHIVPTCIN
jgi:hypothetical protein